MALASPSPRRTCCSGLGISIESPALDMLWSFRQHTYPLWAPLPASVKQGGWGKFPRPLSGAATPRSGGPVFFLHTVSQCTLHKQGTRLCSLAKSRVEGSI